MNSRSIPQIILNQYYGVQPSSTIQEVALQDFKLDDALCDRLVRGVW
ncbi:hypothetical protein [Pseudanabaena sp. SR411]|nr:hypothetical protein [Pseudanabaena sp. SR411]